MEKWGEVRRRSGEKWGEVGRTGENWGAQEKLKVGRNGEQWGEVGRSHCVAALSMSSHLFSHKRQCPLDWSTGGCANNCKKIVCVKRIAVAHRLTFCGCLAFDTCFSLLCLAFEGGCLGVVTQVSDCAMF